MKIWLLKSAEPKATFFSLALSPQWTAFAEPGQVTALTPTLTQKATWDAKWSPLSVLTDDAVLTSLVPFELPKVLKRLLNGRSWHRQLEHLGPRALLQTNVVYSLGKGLKS